MQLTIPAEALPGRYVHAFCSSLPLNLANSCFGICGVCAGHVCTASGHGSTGKAAPDEEDPKAVPDQLPASEGAEDVQLQVEVTTLSLPLSVSGVNYWCWDPVLMCFGQRLHIFL